MAVIDDLRHAFEMVNTVIREVEGRPVWTGSKIICLEVVVVFMCPSVLGSYVGVPQDIVFGPLLFV